MQVLKAKLGNCVTLINTTEEVFNRKVCKGILSCGTGVGSEVHQNCHRYAEMSLCYKWYKKYPEFLHSFPSSVRNTHLSLGGVIFQQKLAVPSNLTAVKRP